jgi:transcriptional regulator with XRE-family HTH domain
MSASFRSETQEALTQELRSAATSSPVFDRHLAAEIGTRVAIRRNLCGLSKLQLGERLGIDTAGVSAYEQGEKRMSCRLLLETAKHLNATPRFFFQSSSYEPGRFVAGVGHGAHVGLERHRLDRGTSESRSRRIDNSCPAVVFLDPHVQN